MGSSVLYILVLCLTVTWVGLALLTKGPLRMLAMDHPNGRSLHQKVTPRTGGLAVMAGILVAWIFMHVAVYWLLLPTALMAMSLIDDIRGLPVLLRLAVQTLICLAFLLCIPDQGVWWVYVGLTLMMVWLVNLYNFMDGADGLAGGMALCGFVSYAAAAYLHGRPELAAVMVMIVLANMVFLCYNFHPASIFMGDVGSIPIGFLAAAFGIYGWNSELWSWWFPCLVFSPFIVDATVTMLKRLINGEKIWQAHRSHYYQRLVQMGWGHRKTAIVEYILMSLVALSALAILDQPYQNVTWVLSAWLVIYSLIMHKIDKAWAVSQRGGGI